MVKKMDLYLTRFEKVICGSGLIFVTFLIFINVVLRYFFNASLSWSDEMVRYIMILISFLGASLCVREGAHISVDFFINKIKGNNRKIMEIFINAVGLLFTVIITILAAQLIYQNIIHPQNSPALQVPMYIPYMSILLGFFLSSVRYIQLIFTDISFLKKDGEQAK